MNNEHPAVARFREVVSSNNVTAVSTDDEFAEAVGTDFDRQKYPDLWAFVNEVHGSRSYRGCQKALADYDRLIAERATPTEHPDIAAYRAAVASVGGVSAREDCAFFKAILSDERVRDALFDDNEDFGTLRSEMQDALLYGYIGDEAGALADYDAIVGNVKPVVEQVKAAEAKLGDSLNGMARTLDTLAEEFRRIADSL